MKLLSTNSKINKSNNTKYHAMILQLAPHKTSGYNVCSAATKACSKDCLFYAGMGIFKNIQKARVNRTKLFFEDQAKFLELLHKDLSCLEKSCLKKGLKGVVRLNGLSDLDWYKIDPTIFNYNIQFYDYTKVAARYRQYLLGNMPKNYHLTFSRSEKNQDKCIEFLSMGGNIAVVGELKNKKLPKSWLSNKVINGDVSDFRFLDKPGTVCWLTPKGKMKKDTSGFVYRG